MGTRAEGVMSVGDRIGATEIMEREREKSKTQGRCDTTLTERFENPKCRCNTYPDNLGPCKTWEVGMNGRCVYCDHENLCHAQIIDITQQKGSEQDAKV